MSKRRNRDQPIRCPICGKPTAYVSVQPEGEVRLCQVVCARCGTRGPIAKEEWAAATLWNTRRSR